MHNKYGSCFQNLFVLAQHRAPGYSFRPCKTTERFSTSSNCNRSDILCVMLNINAPVSKWHFTNTGFSQGFLGLLIKIVL